MGNLSTCMICRTETIKAVTVSFGEGEPVASVSTYCSACWDKLAAYSWKLTLMEREARGDWSKEIAQ